MKNETSFKDIEVQCVDCGQTFTITAGEQRFFLEKGLALPKRCKACREKGARTSSRRMASSTRSKTDSNGSRMSGSCLLCCLLCRTNKRI